MVDVIVSSMRTIGQRNPITVYSDAKQGPGRYLVIGGETRRRAAIMLGWEHLDAIVDHSVDPDDFESLVGYSSALNAGYRESEIDRALSAQVLQQNGLSLFKIANALSLDSKTTAQRLIRMANLPPSLLAIGESNPERFSSTLASLAHDALNRHGQEFAERLLHDGLRGISHRQLAKLVQGGPTASTEHLPADGIARRKKREAGDNLQLNGAPSGRYDLFKTPVPGRKAFRLELETDATTMDRFHQEFQRWFASISQTES